MFNPHNNKVAQSLSVVMMVKGPGAFMVSVPVQLAGRNILIPVDLTKVFVCHLDLRHLNVMTQISCHNDRWHVCEMI